jgi:hypothetical protein
MRSLSFGVLGLVTALVVVSGRSSLGGAIVEVRASVSRQPADAATADQLAQLVNAGTALPAGLAAD